MQNQIFFFLKSALVLWVLFLNDLNLAGSSAPETHATFDCDGLRSLRQLYRDSPES